MGARHLAAGTPAMSAGLAGLLLRCKLLHELLANTLADAKGLGTLDEVIDLVAVATPAEDARAVKHGKMLGDVRLARTDEAQDFADRPFLLADGVKDRQANWRRQHRKELGDGLQDLLRILAERFSHILRIDGSIHDE